MFSFSFFPPPPPQKKKKKNTNSQVSLVARCDGAREIEFDGVGRNGQVINYAISEHVEAKRTRFLPGGGGGKGLNSRFLWKNEGTFA